MCKCGEQSENKFEWVPVLLYGKNLHKSMCFKMILSALRKCIKKMLRFLIFGTLSAKNNRSRDCDSLKQFTNTHFCLEQRSLVRVRILRCYVFSILLYGLGSWIIKQTHMEKVQAFEMWCYRQMLRISWKDKVVNIEVLKRMYKKCELLFLNKARKLKYFAHVVWETKYSLKSSEKKKFKKNFVLADVEFR